MKAESRRRETRPSRYPLKIYERPSNTKLRQGDIAICEFHQMRNRSGDLRGPAHADDQNERLPFLGTWRDAEVDVPWPGGTTRKRVIRIWIGPVMVLHQSCEIQNADQEDSRIIVAPIVSKAKWPTGPWTEIRTGAIPGYLYLRSTNEDETKDLGLGVPWEESAVALASTTSSSRGIVKSARVLSLATPMVPILQEALVRFSSVRGWASARDMLPLVGKKITAISETSEIVPGPSRLAKVTLEDKDGLEETTVVWGVRPSGKMNN